MNVSLALNGCEQKKAPGVRVAFLRAPEGVSIELLDRNVA